MTMFNPPHPGEILKEDILPELDLNVTEAAKKIGVTRVALSRVLNGQAGISIAMALKIEKWLGVANGGSARSWLDMQLDYDLFNARSKAA